MSLGPETCFIAIILSTTAQRRFPSLIPLQGNLTTPLVWFLAQPNQVRSQVGARR